MIRTREELLNELRDSVFLALGLSYFGFKPGSQWQLDPRELIRAHIADVLDETENWGLTTAKQAGYGLPENQPSHTELFNTPELPTEAEIQAVAVDIHDKASGSLMAFLPNSNASVYLSHLVLKTAKSKAAVASEINYICMRAYKADEINLAEAVACKRALLAHLNQRT